MLQLSQENAGAFAPSSRSAKLVHTHPTSTHLLGLKDLLIEFYFWCQTLLSPGVNCVLSKTRPRTREAIFAFSKIVVFLSTVGFCESSCKLSA